MQTQEYQLFAKTILEYETKSLSFVQGKDIYGHAGTSAATPAPGPLVVPPPTVPIPRVKDKIKMEAWFSFGPCKTAADLWKLWLDERPALQRLLQGNDVIQAHSLVQQKRRLEGVASVIMRLAEEEGSVQDGVEALQSVWEEFDALERSLGGKNISIPMFVEGIEAVRYCTQPGALAGFIKGRSKARKQDLKDILDRRWRVTSAWPSVSYSDEPEDLPQGKRLKC